MSTRTRTRNAFETQLDGAITSGATTIPVDSIAGLVAPLYLVIEPDSITLREYIRVGSVSGSDLLSVDRGEDGSAAGAQGHASGAVVRAVFVHQMLDETFDDIEALETADAGHFGGTDIADHPEATTSVRGFMSGADKTKLDAFDHGALAGLGDDDHTQYLTDAQHDQAHGAIHTERTTNQSIPDNTPTTVVYDTIIREDDADGDFSYAVGTGILTINTTGWYHIVAGTIWTGSSLNPHLGIYLNGTSVQIAGVNCEGGISDKGVVSTMRHFVATNTLRIIVEQGAGGSANVFGSEESFFSAVKLRD